MPASASLPLGNRRRAPPSARCTRALPRATVAPRSTSLKRPGCSRSCDAASRSSSSACRQSARTAQASVGEVRVGPRVHRRACKHQVPQQPLGPNALARVAALVAGAPGQILCTASMWMTPCVRLGLLCSTTNYSNYRSKFRGQRVGVERGVGYGQWQFSDVCMPHIQVQRLVWERLQRLHFAATLQGCRDPLRS